jgi:glyoxylase I family protein
VQNSGEADESYWYRWRFFRAKDPAALSEWYEKQLGIDGMQWVQQHGPTAFVPFPADTDYFGSASQNLC